MDEKKKQELAGLLSMVGVVGGGVGTLAGGGSLIHNAVGANKAIDQQYQNRILGKTNTFTLASLNPQQRAAVKRLTGHDVSTWEGGMPVGELPVKVNGRDFLLKELIFDKQYGVNAKLPKDAGGLQLREAINQLVVPVQQQVLNEAQNKVRSREVLKDTLSQHVAEGGLIPKVERGSGRFNMIGQGTSASALRQGAAGSTAPTSSLITNEGFETGPRMSFNQIAGRLPAGHPSAFSGNKVPGTDVISTQRGLQGQTTPSTLTEPVPQAPGAPRTPMATQTNNFTGPETFPERQAAYRETVKQLRPTGLNALRAKIKVPGTGTQAVKGLVRGAARGIARSPTSAKVGAGALVAGGALKFLADNYTSDKMVEDAIRDPVEGTQPGARPPAGSTKNTPVPNEGEQQIIDIFDQKYNYLSKDDKLSIAKRMAAEGKSFSATARIWLKYNASN